MKGHERFDISCSVGFFCGTKPIHHGNVEENDGIRPRRRYTDYPTGSPPVLTLKELPLLMEVGICEAESSGLLQTGYPWISPKM